VSKVKKEKSSGRECIIVATKGDWLSEVHYIDERAQSLPERLRWMNTAWVHPSRLEALDSP
jgi:hypothetical protein